MALVHSPKVATDGLVFYYDMSNTQKSWKGAPTTNLITYPQADWNGSSFALTYDYKGNGVGNATQTFDTSVETPLGDNSGVMKYTTGSAGITTYPDGYKYWAIRISGLTAGVTYTFSYYAKASIASNFSNGQLWRDTGTDYSPSGDWNPTFTTEWKRYSTTRVMVGTYLDYFPIHSGNLTGGHTIYYWGFQMEAGSFATPFVAGTRSTTQAIVALIGNNTITANSLTYASDGTFSFNGSSNHIVVSNGMNALIGTSSVTFSAWIYRTSAPAYWSGIIANKVNVSDGICLLVNPDSKIFWQYDGGTSGVYAIYGGATLATNTWYNIVGVYDNVGLKTYLNGVLNDSASDAGKYILSAGNMDITIGAQDTGPGGPFPGKIAQCLIYNRALTATEIAQNFNAHRSRYGI
jgi:hypothetical protein